MVRVVVIVTALAGLAAPTLAGEGAGNPFPGPNVAIGGTVQPLPSIRSSQAPRRPQARVARPPASTQPAPPRD